MAKIERKYVSQCVSSDYCKGWNDAVDSIVFCKDCTAFMAESSICSDTGYEVSDDDFCSFGERRNDA